MNRYVLSLYDFTGEAVRPWAEAGYACHLFDIQHTGCEPVEQVGDLGGTIVRHHADLHNPQTFRNIAPEEYSHYDAPGFSEVPVAFLSAFPVCTDLAVSGARHFAAKEAANPGFQVEAAMYAKWCAQLGDYLGCPYYVENPVSRLATLWRKPDHRFDPCEYGGYIDEADAAHPRWPDHIAPRDAYTKKTCLWTGGGFVMPERDPVEPIFLDYTKADGTVTRGSWGFGKLGGKSQRTKDIRSATPRGFAKAVFEANSQSLTRGVLDAHNHNPFAIGA